MDKDTLEYAVDVFFHQEAHQVYNREYVAVQVEFPNSIIEPIFPIEGQFYGLENNKLEQVVVYQRDRDINVDAIYSTPDGIKIVRTTVDSHPEYQITTNESLENYLETIDEGNAVQHIPARRIYQI